LVKVPTQARQRNFDTDPSALDNRSITAHRADGRDPRSWTQLLARYREPNHVRSIVEIVITLGSLAALWVLAWAAYYFGCWWLTLLLAVPAALFLVRLFAIQHDCGHGALFRHRLANDWVGRAIGVVTLTPYDFWRRAHAIHHATSGHLGRRGIGDIDTLTVREYLSRSFWGRACYRTYRNPLVMFGFGPAYVFVLKQRLPIGMMRRGWSPWLSTMGTNAAIAGIAATLIWTIGIVPFLLVQLPIILFAGSFGVWLFYVQHQFERTLWAHEGEWTLHEAALHGSSHYDLPNILRWFTANIGAHHIHHLCSRIPFYQLPRALRDHPELRALNRLTVVDSFRCMRLVLWDEGRHRLISFREMRLHRDSNRDSGSDNY
jgi:omega-6 fatty acid desaturase (delta-12 desaturase)